jgi:iron complex outermembrane receptor protein
LPIIHATFQYGHQNGLSDQKGIIRFNYQAGKDMYLSHIGYGSWRLSEKEIIRSMNQGYIFRESTSRNIHPVTVIAVHQFRDKSSSLDLDEQDKLSHDGGALLSQIPAISGIRKGPSYGFDPVLRGFKYEQLNVVLNGGQCSTTACPNRMDPPTSQIAPNMMDRIEIIKGPHALRYGGALGATINYVLPELRFPDQPSVYGRLSGSYEKNGTVLRSEGVIGFSSANYDIGIFGSWSGGNDYLSGTGGKIPADFSRGSIGTNLATRLRLDHEIRLSVTRNIARDSDFPALPMDLRRDDTWLFNLQHEVVLDHGKLQGWSSMIYGSLVDHLMDNRLKPLEPRTMNAETGVNTYNYGGRTEGKWKLDNGVLYAGADLRIEGADGSRIREFLTGPNAGNIVTDNVWQNSRISKPGIFSELQIYRNFYRFIFSGRMEFNHSILKDPDPEFEINYPDLRTMQINPSISAGVIRDFNPGFSLGFWVGRSQRSGSLTERYINSFPVGQDPYEMLGNPKILPEVNHQMDLTFKWKRKGTSLNLDVFCAFLPDYISSSIDPDLSPRISSSPGVRRYYNLDMALNTGFEFNWIQSLFAGLQHKLGLAYTYGQDLERHEPLPEIAPLDIRYQVEGSYIKKKLRPELMFRYVVEQYRISIEYGETVTPGFGLMDLRVSYQVLKNLRLNAAVNNVFNTLYYEHLSRSVRGTQLPIYAPGRSFMASFLLDFI